MRFASHLPLDLFLFPANKIASVYAGVALHLGFGGQFGVEDRMDKTAGKFEVSSISQTRCIRY